MTAQLTPQEHAELTLRRLNRACNDLGLILGGLPPFVIDTYGRVRLRGRGDTIASLNDFASKLENLAVTLEAHQVLRSALRPAEETSGQLKLPGMEQL